MDRWSQENHERKMRTARRALIVVSPTADTFGLD
jgi:hypothetical protein